ncbi:MAG: hypothetical protein AAB521_02960 [Patescibacteria group bacterium]
MVGKTTYPPSLPSQVVSQPAGRKMDTFALVHAYIWFTEIVLGGIHWILLGGRSAQSPPGDFALA